MSIKYTTALLSFVDILGFKALIETASPDVILGILSRKETLGLERLSIDKGGFLGGGLTTFNFSDLIVNVHKINDGYESNGNLVYLVHNHFRAIGGVQWALVRSGVFVRGGIALGQIYASKRTLFGPALIRAYELESRRAKWPIIAIDEECLQEIDRQLDAHFDYRNRTEPSHGIPREVLRHHLYGQFITRTDDGVPFLDYLACMLYEDEATGDFALHLANHKEAVLAAYARHKHYKYEFLARNHNRVCEKLGLTAELIQMNAGTIG